MPRKRQSVEAVSAFRWFANALENAALEVYMMHPGIDKEVSKILHEALCRVRELGEGPKGLGQGSCPMGWCPDANRCYPCVEPPVEPGPSLTRGSKPRRPPRAKGKKK